MVYIWTLMKWKWSSLLGTRVAGLEDTFERIFERRTMTWNPVEGFELDDKELDHEALLECAPALGVAAGLAARASA